ncbi:MAG: hypothetical protein LBS42_08765 [Tannerella sp.]|jgi:hypothetical protein|nr:hypothetical protein [Tannerella sp.]
MAKNKKRKKVQPTHHLKKPVLVKHSQTYLEACYAMARRIFRAIGEDEAAFDIFTKRQKQDIFRVMTLPPRIAAMSGHMVPRQYIRYIQEELIQYLKRVYFDEEAGVTWMDMVTVGQSMLLMFALESFAANLLAPQREVVERLHKAFDEQDIFIRVQETMAGHIKTTLMMLSQPNFRIYGQYIGEHMPTGRACLIQTVRITTHESQSLRFKYHNRERTAFRIATGQFMNTPYTGATIAMSKIFPGIAHDRQLNIYIQSHAIHRFKERIDTLYPILRNEFFVLSLMMVQRVVRAPNGMQLIACIMPSENGEKTIGYFAFTIDGDNLLVLTLLPLLSRNVPEGRILHERLQLSPEDMKYLGMDKLSFFYEVDIAQIPVLRQVLYDELHLDYIHTVYNSFRSRNDPFNEKKTLFVKNFFRKLEEQPADHADVLNELMDTDEDAVPTADMLNFQHEDTGNTEALHP